MKLCTWKDDISCAVCSIKCLLEFFNGKKIIENASVSFQWQCSLVELIGHSITLQTLQTFLFCSAFVQDRSLYCKFRQWLDASLIELSIANGLFSVLYFLSLAILGTWYYLSLIDVLRKRVLTANVIGQQEHSPGYLTWFYVLLPSIFYQKKMLLPFLFPPSFLKTSTF